MMLIQNGTQGPTTPPAKQTAVGTPGYAYGGPPGSTPATRWDPDVANTVLAELKAIATAAGDALDPTNNAQCLAALKKIFGQLATANAWSGAQTFNGGLTATTGAFSGAVTAPNGTTGAQVVNVSQFSSGGNNSSWIKRVPDANSPSGVWIEQGGTGAVSTGGIVAITFPVAFPNACVQVLAEEVNPAGTWPLAQPTLYAADSTMSKTGCAIYGLIWTGSSWTGASGGIGFRYRATGY